MVSLVEFTDPCCFWAWGAQSKIRRLQWRYGDRLDWRRVQGDLFLPDWHTVEFGLPDVPQWYLSPEIRKGMIEFHAGISATPGHGQPFPARLDWCPTESSQMCRAVRAAELQGPEVARRLLRRLREDWMVFGRPADTRERILGSAAAAAIPGLDVERLAADLEGPEVAAASEADFEEVRNPNAAALAVTDERIGFGRPQPQRGRTRYAFTTLVFDGPGGEHTVPGFRPWEVYLEALHAAAGPEEAAALERDAPADPTPAEALERFGLVTGPEFELLCGPGWEPPADAVLFDSGGGPVWMTPAEASTRTEYAR
jgi:hypothetical protein